MNTTLYANFLCLLVTAGLFAFLFYGPWQHFVVDATRQRLFEIRDSLFDQAVARGRLNSHAYRLAREVMNAQIRYAHELDIPHFVLTALGSLGSRRGPLNAATGFVDKLVADEKDEPFKAEIRAALRQTLVTSATAIFRRSLLCITLLPVLLALALVAESTLDAASLAVRIFGAPLRAPAYSDAIEHAGMANGLRA